MIKSVALPLAFCGLILGGQALMAASVTGLNDWCFNVNGNSSASNACNGGAGPVLPGADLSAFDTALVASNNLGTAVFTLGAGLGQFVLFYADYDVDVVAFGSFDDVGTVNGVLPANASYSLDDPNVPGTLFGAFATNTLDNTNHVGTHSGPPATQCCDVAWGLGIGGIDVLAGGSATVTFTVSTTQPTGGFFLQQTNFDTLNTIYATESVVVTGPAGGGVPEPSTFGLGLIAAGAAFLYARKRNRAGLVG